MARERFFFRNSLRRVAVTRWVRKGHWATAVYYLSKKTFIECILLATGQKVFLHVACTGAAYVGYIRFISVDEFDSLIQPVHVLARAQGKTHSAAARAINDCERKAQPDPHGTVRSLPLGQLALLPTCLEMSGENQVHSSSHQQ